MASNRNQHLWRGPGIADKPGAAAGSGSAFAFWDFGARFIEKTLATRQAGQKSEIQGCINLQTLHIPNRGGDAPSPPRSGEIDTALPEIPVGAKPFDTDGNACYF